MATRNIRVLVSGAGIAGLVAAYWLKRHGLTPTVVERAPELRSGGHAVDLWGSAVGVIERMGLLSAVEEARTANDTGITIVPGRQPLTLPLNSLAAPIADRHVELMRGTLVELLYERSRSDVEYIFGDSVQAMEDRDDAVRVSFENAAPRTFDLVIGADGQHSNVRRLAFGGESQFSRYLGAYICGYSVRNDFLPIGQIARYVTPGKTVALSSIRQSGEAAVAFLFREATELDIDHDDVRSQAELVRQRFADDQWHVPALLGGIEQARDFYFNPISQIHMPAWSRGRVALVGDAGYCPAPAVGGGTTLAVVAAYILCGELARAGGDHARAWTHYERETAAVVAASRKIGPALIGALIPKSRLEISLGMRLAWLLLRLPEPMRRVLPLLPPTALQALRQIASIKLNDYERIPRT